MLDFDNVRLGQIRSLFEVFLNVKGRGVEHIEDLYRKRAENFEETLSFVRGLNLIQISNGNVVCAPPLLKTLQNASNAKSFEEEIKRIIIKYLFGGSSSISREFLQYVNRFKALKGEYVYRPTNQDRIKLSGIRNLLMELDLLIIDIDRDFYVLSENFVTGLRRENVPMSPALFHKLQKDKEELGRLAELLVFREEKKRLSATPELLRRVKHLSKSVVNAGYDIESFDGTYTSEGEPTRRFIEVKAVSIDNPRFFWSSNEVGKAEELGRQYWIYLVPYKNKREFDPSSIQRISDPHKNLFLNVAEWKSHVELFSFTRNI